MRLVLELTEPHMIRPHIARRTLLKLSGIAALTIGGWRVLGRQAAPPPARGYGRDPNLSQRVVTWPRTLSTSQLAALAALCDIVLPAEPPHPSAAAVGVHDFLDEWVSAPYPEMEMDRVLVLHGLLDLEDVMKQTHGISFSAASLPQQTTLFDSFCSAIGPRADFSQRCIQLICGGYYTTREGLAAIGYVGNVALASFPGPPPAVVRHFLEALDKL
jgi:Gluconate 2-dehydrogenase subunit 3